MKKPLAACAALSAAIALVACSPLQQAPLVYSSKVVVGIDVSANVAENQGGSISIGVRTIDSAYVPVAVSKEIDPNAGSGAKTPGIERIEARYGEGSSPDNSDPASTAERNRKIDAYFTAKQAADAAAEAQTAAENDVASWANLNTQLETVKSGIQAAQNMPESPLPAASDVPPPPSARAEEFKKRADDVAKLNTDKRVSLTGLVRQSDGMTNAAQVIADIDRSIVSNNINKAAREAQLPELKTQRQAKAEQAARAKDEAIRVAGLSQTNKTDAMSVYGRFDSNGSGTAKDTVGASLLVGKVFSTGLASQNLTEAVKIEAQSRCVANGIDVAKSLTTEDSRKAFLEGLAKMCAPRSTTPPSK